jgi:hypothetical protein
MKSRPIGNLKTEKLEAKQQPRGVGGPALAQEHTAPCIGRFRGHHSFRPFIVHFSRVIITHQVFHSFASSEV